MASWTFVVLLVHEPFVEQSSSTANMTVFILRNFFENKISSFLLSDHLTEIQIKRQSCAFKYITQNLYLQNDFYVCVLSW